MRHKVAQQPKPQSDNASADGSSPDVGEADGDDVVVANNDIVRIKIGRLGKSPILEIASDDPTDEGSTCTAANPTELTLMGADLPFQAGIYDIDATIFDTSEAKAKKVENGVFILRESMLGDLE
mgnify:CR=1 FL=1